MGCNRGPEMLSKNLDLTYTMVWSIALANIIGAGICFAFSDQFAKLALIRYSVLMPLVLSIVFIAAFQGSRNWGDLYAVLAFGLLGWIMKRLKWPRPPLILGVVLGDIVERYLFVSISLFGGDWLLRPGVIILFTISAIGALGPFVRQARRLGSIAAIMPKLGTPRIDVQTAFYVVYLAFFIWLISLTQNWDPMSRLVPLIVGLTGLGLSFTSLIVHTFPRPLSGGQNQQVMHMDSPVDDAGLPTRTMITRAVVFFGWLIFFIVSVALIGVIPTVSVFVIAYMRCEAREPWRLTLALSALMTLFVWGLFEKLLLLPWPPTVLGDAAPWLAEIVPSM